MATRTPAETHQLRLDPLKSRNFYRVLYIQKVVVVDKKLQGWLTWPLMFQVCPTLGGEECTSPPGKRTDMEPEKGPFGNGINIDIQIQTIKFWVPCEFPGV